MAKKRKKKFNFQKSLLYLAVIFSGLLFLLKISFDNQSWFQVFSPLLLAFIIIFSIQVFKTAIRKI